ncbi:MAG: hypothetical protein ABIK65_06755 [Candidatus Eisenbacteria bacterium]
MLRYFRRLEERCQELGNYRRKYSHAIDKHGRLLIDRLEESGRFDQVHLRQPAKDPGAEMDAVLSAGRDPAEMLTLLGCYYAIQYLQMNIRSIDHLRLNASGTLDPAAVYRDFVRRVGEDFVRLVGAYLTRVLDLLLGEGPRPEFVICSVGTRLHQDDVDLGIIDDGSPARHGLNKAIGKMAREMLRWASNPDFYLSEHVGAEGYTVSIDEYRRRLDMRILDFVSVTEILSVYPIAGSVELFEQFKRKIHNRYYYRRRKTIREHEGYLRGLVGEIESLLLWPHDPERVNPKEDLLRMVIGIMSAYRCIHRIQEADTWGAFEQLSRRLKHHRVDFSSLQRSHTFVETFRHLYQQFSAQEEEIDLSDPTEQECLQQVANAMGYRDVGVIRAWEQLLVRYFQHVRYGREAVQSLLPDVEEHIRKITVFAEWVTPGGHAPTGVRRTNLAIDFLRRVRYFQGIKYWNDLLMALEDPENDLLDRFLLDLMALDEAHREQIVKYYAHWGYQTFYTMLRLLVIIGKNRRKPGAREVFEELNEAFLETIQSTPDEIRRLSTVFVYNPNLVYRYLVLLDDEKQAAFHEKLTGKVWDSQVAEWREALYRLCDIVRKSSRFFRRAIERVCEDHPEYMVSFGDLKKLNRITQGMFADLIRAPSYEDQKKLLGAYYDLQFLRIGLATLQGMPLAQLDAEFTEFADHFLETLFDICKAEVDEEGERRIMTHDKLALFVAGGHARERAHQDDYDLVVLLNSDDEEIYQYSNKILGRLNREISRRGIMPQYHLADRFGGFVTRFSELERWLKTEGKESYVDMSQLLGARQIVGSGRLKEEFHRRIIEGCIYSQKDSYVEAVAGEIRSRHEYMNEKNAGSCLDIKECPGGLRDLEMGMLLLKAIHRIREPIGGRFWDMLAEQIPGQRWEFMEMKESFQFLNRLRDVYRLSVAPVNTVNPEHFDRPAALLGYRSTDSVSGGELLARDFEKHITRVARSLDAIIEEVLA